MKKQIHIKALMAVMVFGMMFSSCGKIEIVKRRYRPGFHVDISKKKQTRKAVEQTAVADTREVRRIQTIESKRANPVVANPDQTLTASSGIAGPIKKVIEENNKPTKADLALRGFEKLDFKRWVRDARSGIRPDRSAVAGDDWMSWVAFGTGIGAAAFGFMALLFALLLGWNYFIWFAFLLAGAAITFAILHKKNGGTSSKARLGMILGIVGGGLAFVALIVWIVYLAAAIGALI